MRLMRSWSATVWDVQAGTTSYRTGTLGRQAAFSPDAPEDGESWGDPYGFWTPMGALIPPRLGHGNLVDSSEAHDGWAAKTACTGHLARDTALPVCLLEYPRYGQLESLQYGLGHVIGTEDLYVRTGAGHLRLRRYRTRDRGLNEGDDLWPPSLYESSGSVGGSID